MPSGIGRLGPDGPRHPHRRGFARRWGPLAADTSQAAESRETLVVYLAENRSLVRTGEVLHLHKNTVRYRIGRIYDDLEGTRRVGDTLDLALALRMHRLLGVESDVEP